MNYANDLTFLISINGQLLKKRNVELLVEQIPMVPLPFKLFMGKYCALFLF